MPLGVDNFTFRCDLLFNNLLAVNLLVCFQMGFLSKTSTTNVTTVRFLSCMHKHVSTDVLIWAKTLSTNSALKLWHWQIFFGVLCNVGQSNRCLVWAEICSNGIFCTWKKKRNNQHNVSKSVLRPWVAHLRMTVNKVRGKHCTAHHPAMNLWWKSTSIRHEKVEENIRM